MDEETPRGDDLAELAGLVSALAGRLAALSPGDPVLDDVRRRAARMTSADRGPARLNGVTTTSMAVTEPDGAVRLLISGRATFPTAIQIAGEVMEHPRDTAGMLFFNDEGDECGGLIFGGESGYQGGSLTFDQYHGDQVIQFWHNDSEAGRTAALVINDQPDIPLPELSRRFKELQELPEEDRRAGYERLREEGYAMTQRLMAGKARDGSSRLTLAAPDGTVRIVISVAADGTPSLRLLDGDGKVIWQAP